MMDIFFDFSGIKLNQEKSSFIGFRLSPEELTGCSRILATPTGTLPIRYLGLPLVDRQLRTQDWKPVLEKVESRLAGWRARLLSRGGRLVLLKTVLEAIPIYYMSDKSKLQGINPTSLLWLNWTYAMIFSFKISFFVFP